MPQYYIWTIGCQMNKAESERLSNMFQQQGYQITNIAEQADIIVLNSCVVRQSAENRVINKLNALKSLKKSRSNLTIALTGCLVNSDTRQLENNFPHVDHFFKAGDAPPWLKDSEQNQILLEHPPVSVYVPIIQGCNNFCSYCIVPYRRGQERSRLPAEIVKEVNHLVSRGAKEIVLLGQNVDSYGHDLPDKTDLADLLHELNNIEGLVRLRFLTNHPKDMSSKLIDAIASLDKVCEQINLPIQAGSNEILKLMRREYNTEYYCQLIDRIRNKVPDLAISTDVIVGFPTESEGQFQQTYNLLSEIKFDTIHVAAYSPRTGTMAARELEDNVPASEKKRRLGIIEQLNTDIATEINAKLSGCKVEVLIEGQDKNKWYGRTRTDKLVFCNDETDCLGQLVNVEIEKTSPWSMQGEIISDNKE
ncbi:MiaB/RimO family radical SAM methylthiotransferase [Chloroflexota bacterium]